jgi:hypothetical protein
MDIIEEVSEFYDDLISGKVELEGKEEDFYLPAQ